MTSYITFITYIWFLHVLYLQYITLLFIFALPWVARPENSDLLSVVSTADLTMRLKKEVVAVNCSKKIHPGKSDKLQKKEFEGNQSWGSASVPTFAEIWGHHFNFQKALEVQFH